MWEVFFLHIFPLFQEELSIWKDWFNFCDYLVYLSLYFYILSSIPHECSTAVLKKTGWSKVLLPKWARLRNDCKHHIVNLMGGRLYKSEL